MELSVTETRKISRFKIKSGEEEGGDWCSMKTANVPVLRSVTEGRENQYFDRAVSSSSALLSHFSVDIHF